ncbi:MULTISPECIES: MlaD family protein [unclassified Mycobacterium]|uniref:MlaD family protein n=1 Tax=unclassified Mycobacterium TaxID=2642494 RepID=UPI00074048DD|nr:MULTISPECIES: MlaD family protein [unclassified Mycobacterium]KUH82136.1 mammalian cell entry protein [Mycobacterium sp. IS-1556]KUH82463.1 mammalian cell entry protein [Mycobacterium sp. GA-0227b]KUH89013.1 mammalian cell entry protein [Mycobacterium sp. GA-1999]
MRLFRRNRPALLDEHAAGARSRRIGVIGSLLIVVSLVAAGALYVNPLGQRSYTAHFESSGGARPGDEIRIAGIPVGKVTSIGLDGTVVKMTFEVTKSLVIGSDSTLEIKLLTPLGGHYVALDPKGIHPLGDKVIPPQQTATPFEINDIIQEATPLIQEVDGDVIHDTFSEVANAANKYPDALRDVLQTANTLTTSLSQVTADYHRGLDFLNEYSSAFVAGRQQLVVMAQQFALVGARLTTKSVEIVEFFSLLSELARLVDRLMVFYHDEVAPVAHGIDDIFDTLFSHPERIGEAADGLGQILRIVVPMLSGNGVVIDESDRLMPGEDVCIPNITRQC